MPIPSISGKHTIQKAISQRLLLQNGVLEIQAPGNSQLQAGDIIMFDMPLMESSGHNKKFKSDSKWYQHCRWKSVKWKMNSRTIKGIDHLLFDNEDEFNKYMPNTPIITDWRNGNEGDWVLTDDGQICQVLKRGGLKNSGGRDIYNYYILHIHSLYLLF